MTTDTSKIVLEGLQGREIEDSSVLSDNSSSPPIATAQFAMASPSFGSTCSTLPSSTPPLTPLDNNTKRSGNKNKIPSLHVHPRMKTSSKTPQMMVLGRDDSDYRDLMQSGHNHNQRHFNKISNEKKQALLEADNGKDNVEHFEDEHEHSSTKSSKNKSSKWWGYSLWSGGTATSGLAATASHESGNSDDYTSMEQVEGAALRPSRRQQEHDQQKKARPSNPNQTPNSSEQAVAVEEQTVYYHRMSGQQRQKSNRNAAISQHESILRNLPLPSTREDEIQQECSFLYRPAEEENERNKNKNRARRALRTVLPPHMMGSSSSSNNSATEILYRDAQDVLSPPDMALFQAKYQQLNQAYDVPQEDRFERNYNDYAVTPIDEDDRHELTLEEQQEQPRRPNAVHQRQPSYVTDVTTQSSLFYQVNGRVMLRLPRDRVHLLVADEAAGIEPGILSVIQTRPPPQEDLELGNPLLPQQLQPKQPPFFQLEYCLTVPPNLYQRVLNDMTQCATSSTACQDAHHSGGDLHFYAHEHASIWVAVGIIVFVLVLLGIITLAFGEK